MADDKSTEEFEICEDHLDWLEDMATKYELPDKDKALRIVLDYVMHEAEEEPLFTKIRCNHCDED